MIINVDCKHNNVAFTILVFGKYELTEHVHVPEWAKIDEEYARGEKEDWDHDYEIMFALEFGWKCLDFMSEYDWKELREGHAFMKMLLEVAPEKLEAIGIERIDISNNID